jgi:hypothetical protein
MQGADTKVIDNYTLAYGGGVFLQGDGAKLIMRGNSATISNNLSGINGGGGGVATYHESVEVIMEGDNTTISNNKSNSDIIGDGGGGVCVVNGTFTMQGANARIIDNTATGTGTNDDGGGVCIINGTFRMEAGLLSGNTDAKGSYQLYKASGSAIWPAGTHGIAHKDGISGSVHFATDSDGDAAITDITVDGTDLSGQTTETVFMAEKLPQ